VKINFLDLFYILFNNKVCKVLRWYKGVNKLGKAKVIFVKENSLAQKAGIKKGDEIISINGKPIEDILDYKFYTTDEKLEILIKTKEGEKKVYIEKDFDEDLGLEFKSPIIDSIKVCKNKCVFCFVDQMPRGLRPSLYVKDDDYRLSFLKGTYITLTNLTVEDKKKIFEMHLSPLYISVHATDLNIRNFMLGVNNSQNVLDCLKEFKEKGISFHTQIVLCPGINDGEVLKKTILDLLELFPSVLSIAVVPVGLTRFRENLFPLRDFTKEEAVRVIELIKYFQENNLKKFGKRLVFAADEFYEKAGINFPSYKTYEDFAQWENGVGMAALLSHEIRLYKNKIPKKLDKKRHVAIITGLSAFRLLKKELDFLKDVENLKLEINAIKNEFFGESVTVAGLIVGRDIISQLKGKVLGDVALIPSVMVNEGKLLDDITVKQLSEELNTEVKVVPVNGKALLQSILNIKLGGKRWDLQ